MIKRCVKTKTIHSTMWKKQGQQTRVNKKVIK